MGEKVQTLILSDINNDGGAPYVQILASQTTEFLVAAEPVQRGLMNVANALVRGDFSIYYKTSGGGVVDFEYFLSWNGVDLITPSSSADIITGVTSGTESATGFLPVLAPWLGIRAEETGTGPVNFEKLILTFH